MKKFSKIMRKKYKETNKKSIAIYLILRLFVILSMIFQIVCGNISNVLMCILALILFTIPTILGYNTRHIKWIYMCWYRVFIS